MVRGTMVPNLETPARADALLAQLLAQGHEQVKPQGWGQEWIAAVHEASYLLVSHDLNVIAHMCEQIAFMVEGRFVDVLAPNQLRGARLHHPEAQRLLDTALV